MWDAMSDERRSRDDDCKETVRQLRARLAAAEEERARTAAEREREWSAMRAEITMLRAQLANVTALREAWEDASAYADRTVPLRPWRPDPAGRHRLRAVPAVALVVLIACRGAFSTAGA